LHIRKSFEIASQLRYKVKIKTEEFFDSVITKACGSRSSKLELRTKDSKTKLSD